MNNTLRHQHDSTRDDLYYTNLYHLFVYRVSQTSRCTDARRAGPKRMSIVMPILLIDR